MIVPPWSPFYSTPTYNAGDTRISNSDLHITFSLEPRFGPAFLAAVLDMSNQLGLKLEGTHSNAKTQALTDAAIGFGRLRAATTKVVKTESVAYGNP